ncbi:MAG: acetylxylan esterase [Proteobacteria bacterium]|nr:acetylxylan esterase [Pseudomonadota bacterium]
MLALVRPVLMLLLMVCSALAMAQRAEPEITVLPLVINGKRTDVVAHIYKPEGEGPFPLVIHSHGRAGAPEDRAKLQYPVPVGHGNYWLRKGVAVVAPVRPGYGETGGDDVEHSGTRWKGATCTTEPDFTRVAVNARRTVVATYEWAQKQPWVRPDRILIQGQSVGGLTTVATAALNLPGVVGTVNFAGGSGGYPEVSPAKSCKPDNLTRTFREFGGQARGPSLWLYAANDQYWGADMPRAWHEAYAAGGSDSTFVMTGTLVNRDGHQLLLHGGRMWSVPLDAFIKKVGLLAP